MHTHIHTYLGTQEAVTNSLFYDIAISGHVETLFIFCHIHLFEACGIFTVKTFNYFWGLLKEKKTLSRPIFAMKFQQRKESLPSEDLKWVIMYKKDSPAKKSLSEGQIGGLEGETRKTTLSKGCHPEKHRLCTRCVHSALTAIFAWNFKIMLARAVVCSFRGKGRIRSI